MINWCARPFRYLCGAALLVNCIRTIVLKLRSDMLKVSEDTTTNDTGLQQGHATVLNPMNVRYEQTGTRTNGATERDVLPESCRTHPQCSLVDTGCTRILCDDVHRTRSRSRRSQINLSLVQPLCVVSSIVFYIPRHTTVYRSTVTVLCCF